MHTHRWHKQLACAQHLQLQVIHGFLARPPGCFAQSQGSLEAWVCCCAGRLDSHHHQHKAESTRAARCCASTKAPSDAAARAVALVHMLGQLGSQLRNCRLPAPSIFSIVLQFQAVGRNCSSCCLLPYVVFWHGPACSWHGCQATALVLYGPAMVSLDVCIAAQVLLRLQPEALLLDARINPALANYGMALSVL